jgi:hypothetical protein
MLRCPRKRVNSKPHVAAGALRGHRRVVACPHDVDDADELGTQLMGEAAGAEERSLFTDRGGSRDADPFAVFGQRLQRAKGSVDAGPVVECRRRIAARRDLGEVRPEGHGIANLHSGEGSLTRLCSDVEPEIGVAELATDDAVLGCPFGRRCQIDDKQASSDPRGANN